MTDDRKKNNMPEDEERLLRQRDENPLKPVHSNMVENLKEEIIKAYEDALEANDKDVVKRMEWEFSTISIHKKELRDYVARRKAARGGSPAVEGPAEGPAEEEKTLDESEGV
ncbi:MAG: hypothetical protein IK115_05445 [Lachnospiraceae bacterium]|nr:hypothetical protein [Lachnospiraceae bacterium]